MNHSEDVCAVSFVNLSPLPPVGHAPPSQPPSQPPTSAPPSHPPSSHKTQSTSARKHGPTELSLGAFLTTPTGVSRPHPHVVRPQQNKTKAKDLRQVCCVCCTSVHLSVCLSFHLPVCLYHSLPVRLSWNSWRFVSKATSALW